jgi:sulfur-carrier protein
VSHVELHLPATLTPLFPGLDRRHELDAESVADALAQLDGRFPGLEARVCEPGPRLRPHIQVFVDRERADLAVPLRDGARIDVIAAISGG